MRNIFKGVYLSFLLIIDDVDCGCYNNNPSWGSSYEGSKGPRVSVSSGRVVTVSWSLDMVQYRQECADYWQIIVQNGGKRKRLCYGNVETSRSSDYVCTLDLTSSDYCGEVFYFSIVLVNNYEDTNIVSPMTSKLNLVCGGLSSVRMIPSSSSRNAICSSKPYWRQKPTFYQYSNTYSLVRIEWNSNQIRNLDCVTEFVFKYWKTGNQRHTQIRYSVDDDQNTFGGDIAVKPCSSYNYRLTALSRDYQEVTTSGTFDVQCSSVGSVAQSRNSKVNQYLPI